MNNSGPNVYSNNPYSSSGVSTKTANLVKIFAYMMLGLLVTGATSIGFSFLFRYVQWTGSEGAMMGVYVGAIIASIGTLVCTIFAGSLSFTSQRKPTSHSVAIPFGIYAILIGYLFGMIILGLPQDCGWEILGVSFGTTAALFGVLALIGLLSKGNLNLLGFIGSALIGGALMLSFVNLMLMLFWPGFMAMYWVISFAIFAGLMFSTIWDVWHIKTISEHYENTPNLNLFCAFRLYCDFVAIFVRILYFVMIFYARNR